MARAGGPAAALSEIKSLNKNCKSCQIELTTINASRAYKKERDCYRNVCLKCRNKQVSKSYVGNPKRQSYMRYYIRRVGKVKEYPCETCNKPCYKKYERAFCTDICRFMAYVEKIEQCWIWQGCKNRRGYGKFAYKKNKHATAHRVSYELFKGPIENNLFVCHECDNPSCVNPDHLWLGTHVENMIDMIEKGRQSSKMTPKKVIEIRKLWDHGVSNAKLQEIFKVTSGTISSIVNRRIWKHV